MSVLCAALFLLCGCKRPEEPARPPPPGPALPQAGTVDGQLGAEAAARLHDAETISLEALTAALAKEGLSFGPPKQLMARTHQALYCARADAAGGIDLTVCEYPTAEQATKGEAESVLKKMAGHESRVRGKTVLHVVRRSDAPDADVAKVWAAFETLAAGDGGR